MVITAPRPSDTIKKLLQLADGDRELVHEAIKASVDASTGEADLARVVSYIKDKKNQKHAA